MTIEQIQASLPNGFHDAQITSIHIDLRERNIVMEMQLWVGDLIAADKRIRELHRQATLTIEGFLFSSIGPPDERYLNNQTMVISSDGQGWPPPSPAVFSGRIPDGFFIHWFYLSSSNSFLQVAAKSASLVFSP
jgi:hypothetical protein